ncbi:MAG: spermidine synthase [Alphaproteobacteria bacterium]|nr:spermidine synthase [Alphaproteobacteria bacterium]
MSASFEELDYQPTPMGAISLRRRRDLSRGIDVYEIKLGDELLMSSLFTTAEIELARLGLAALPGNDLEVVVGGLGLGYTAQAVLADSRVSSLVVVEALPAVIDWHERQLLPLGAALTADVRCRFVCGDFFAMLASPAQGLDPTSAGRRFDAVLVDIDHSPRNVLHASHAPFYSPHGLRRLAEHLKPGGVFGLWSNDAPDDAFRAALAEVFATTDARVITFRNARQDGDSTATIYLARHARGRD